MHPSTLDVRQEVVEHDCGHLGVEEPVVSCKWYPTTGVAF